MKLIVDQLDINKTRLSWPPGAPFEPAMVRAKDKLPGNKWQVLTEQLLPGDTPVWSLAEYDEYVRVPLFSYDLNPSADLALAFMLQLGLACSAYIPNNVTHLYVVTGTPVELLYDVDTDVNTSIRCWIGFAVITD